MYLVNGLHAQYFLQLLHSESLLLKIINYDFYCGSIAGGIIEFNVAALLCFLTEDEFYSS